jgi:hypothetical protein
MLKKSEATWESIRERVRSRNGKNRTFSSKFCTEQMILASLQGLRRRPSCQRFVSHLAMRHAERTRWLRTSLFCYSSPVKDLTLLLAQSSNAHRGRDAHYWAPWWLPTIRECRDPAGFVLQLSDRCAALSRVPSLLPAVSTAGVDRLGQERLHLPPEGALPYPRDLRNVETHLLDTDHFALETHGEEIASRIEGFLRQNKLAH